LGGGKARVEAEGSRGTQAVKLSTIQDDWSCIHFTETGWGNLEGWPMELGAVSLDEAVCRHIRQWRPIPP